MISVQYLSFSMELRRQTLSVVYLFLSPLKVQKWHLFTAKKKLNPIFWQICTST